MNAAEKQTSDLDEVPGKALRPAPVYVEDGCELTSPWEGRYDLDIIDDVDDEGCPCRKTVASVGVDDNGRFDLSLTGRSIDGGHLLKLLRYAGVVS